MSAKIKTAPAVTTRQGLSQIKIKIIKKIREI
jgi:hypothetical protein